VHALFYACEEIIN